MLNLSRQTQSDRKTRVIQTRDDRPLQTPWRQNSIRDASENRRNPVAAMALTCRASAPSVRILSGSVPARSDKFADSGAASLLARLGSIDGQAAPLPDGRGSENRIARNKNRLPPTAYY